MKRMKRPNMTMSEEGSVPRSGSMKRGNKMPRYTYTTSPISPAAMEGESKACCVMQWTKGCAR